MMKKDISVEMINEALRLPERVEDYSFEDAIRLTQTAIKVKDSPFLHFSLACFYSSGNKITESLIQLEIALRQGFEDWEKVANDPSLFEARRTREFWQTVEKYIQN